MILFSVMPAVPERSPQIGGRFHQVRNLYFNLMIAQTAGRIAVAVAVVFAIFFRSFLTFSLGAIAILGANAIYEGFHAHYQFVLREPATGDL